MHKQNLEIVTKDSQRMMKVPFLLFYSQQNHLSSPKVDTRRLQIGHVSRKIHKWPSSRSHRNVEVRSDDIRPEFTTGQSQGTDARL